MDVVGVQVQEVPADAGDVAQPLAPRLRRNTGLERPEVESSGRGGEEIDFADSPPPSSVTE